MWGCESTELEDLGKKMVGKKTEGCEQSGGRENVDREKKGMSQKCRVRAMQRESESERV